MSRALTHVQLLPRRPLGCAWHDVRRWFRRGLGCTRGRPASHRTALRYAIACGLLVGWVRLTGSPLHLPHGVEWMWLLGVSISGLVLFNVALVHGSRHAEPAVLAVAVACVPVALAAVGPLLEGHRLRTRVLAAAGVVSAGAMVVEGLGRCDAVGLLWALVVFGCEAGFTLLAVPVLGRHGPAGVSVHTTWLAAAIFGVLGLVPKDGRRQAISTPAKSSRSATSRSA